MRLYCLISFWTIVLGMLCRVFFVMNAEYPRTVVYRSAAEDVMWLVFSIGMAVWLGSLLWGWL